MYMAKLRLWGAILRQGGSRLQSIVFYRLQAPKLTYDRATYRMFLDWNPNNQKSPSHSTSHILHLAVLRSFQHRKEAFVSIQTSTDIDSTSYPPIQRCSMHNSHVKHFFCFVIVDCFQFFFFSLFFQFNIAMPKSSLIRR